MTVCPSNIASSDECFYANAHWSSRVLSFGALLVQRWPYVGSVSIWCLACPQRQVSDLMVQHGPTVAAICQHGEVCTQRKLADYDSQIIVQNHVHVCWHNCLIQAICLLRVISGDLCSMTAEVEE